MEFLLSGRMAFAIDDGPTTILDQPTVFWHQPRCRYRYGAVAPQGWHHHWVLMDGPRARRRGCAPGESIDQVDGICFAFDPRDPKVFYFGASAGVYKPADGGQAVTGNS